MNQASRPPSPSVRAGLSLLLTAWAGLSAGCTKFDLLNNVIPSCGYRRTAGLAYGDLPRQKLDVYRPRSVAAPPDAAAARGAATAPAGSAPVVVFFYGGSWQSGERGNYRFVAEALTSRGFVAVLPDYRLYPSVTFPAFMEDAARAVRWTKDNAGRFGGDPGRVFLMGHSAGAHIAALLTLDESYLEAAGLTRDSIRGAAALSGPYDFTYLNDDIGVVFGPAATFREKDPIHFVDGREPPMLLQQGLKDKIVDPKNAPALADRIRQAGGRVKLIEYPKLGHASVVLALAKPFRWLGPVLDDAAAFFREH